MVSTLPLRERMGHLVVFCPLHAGRVVAAQ